MSTIADSTDNSDIISGSSSNEYDACISIRSSPEPVDLVEHLDELCSTNGMPFPVFCSKTFDFLAQEIPEIESRIEKFTTNPLNQPMLAKWKNQSWNDLKTAHKNGLVTEEEMHEWHAFRIRAKNEIEKIIHITLAHFNYLPIRWQMVGTPGWSSDIDNSALCDQPNGELSVSIGKLLFDVLWFQSFGELSGIQADLETYTSHAGERETYLQLETDEGKRLYASVAFFGAHIALIRSMDSNEWQAYQHEFIITHEKLFGGDVAAIYAQLFDEVEAFQNECEKEIFREAYISMRMKAFPNLSASAAREAAESDFNLHPLSELRSLMQKIDTSHRDHKIARYNIKMGKLFKLGCLIDHQDNRIFSLEKQLMVEKDPQSQLSLQKRIDMCHIEIARLNILRESLQDEGYITQGAYLNVCKHAGSQIDIRGREKISRQMSVRGISGTQRQRRSSLPHELIESVLENGAGHFHKLHLHATDPMTGLVESAKYGQRVIDASLPLMSRERRLSKAQVFLVPETTGSPAALLLALKRKTLAANMLPALLANGLRKQNETVQALYDHMQKAKESAPPSKIKPYFYRHLYQFFTKGQKVDLDFVHTFKTFLKYEFGEIENNWEALQTKLEKCFPIYSNIENTALLIDSMIQSAKKKLGSNYALISSTDRYKFLLQEVGIQQPFTILNPGNYEPLDPFMGAIISSVSSYTRHNFHQEIPELLEIQKREVLESLGIYDSDELPAFIHQMNQSMRTFLIETHAYAVSHHKHPIALPMRLKE